MPGEAVLREVSLTLPMAPEIEIAASEAATTIAEEIRMSADRIDEIRMAVVEACINAIEYSHAADRMVYLRFAVLGVKEPEGLRITIHDNGVGFRPETVADPVFADKLKAERKRGWGLKIIRGLMDEVEILSGATGTTVVMVKLR